MPHAAAPVPHAAAPVPHAAAPVPHAAVPAGAQPVARTAPAPHVAAPASAQTIAYPAHAPEPAGAQTVAYPAHSPQPAGAQTIAHPAHPPQPAAAQPVARAAPAPHSGAPLGLAYAAPLPPAPQAAPRSSSSGLTAQPAPLNIPRSSSSGLTAQPHPDSDPRAAPIQAPRVAPPSPVEFAQARPAVAMPQVTPNVPSHGGVVPEGQAENLNRPAQQLRTQPAPQPLPVHDEPEPLTIPSMPAQRPAAALVLPRAAHALPAAMLVTQPGVPGPFAHARELSPPQAALERPAVAAVTAAPKPEQPLRLGSDAVTAEPASLWRRTGAWLTDLLFVGVLVLGLLFVAMQVIAPKNLTPLQQLTAIALPGLGLAGILAFVYTALFAFLWSGRTPGRRLLGIHLVDTTGHAPAPMRALVRALLSLVSFGLFLSGFWLALFDRHGQTLHDKLTRTFVVKIQDA